MPPKKNNSLAVKVAEHGVKIEDLETRVKERRDADEKLFDAIEGINKNISSLREDFAGWKGRMTVIGSLALLIVSAVFKYLL